MKYLSVCSGIEAASVAWAPLGWQPVAFSEIEPFPRAVLSHRFPGVPLHGDFTRLRHEPWIVDADATVGGTPCQAFSVAGLRHSLDDERGNLALEFIRLADAIDDLRRAAGRPPAWVIWENVPGVLSTHDNAFGAFLGGLVGGDDAIEPPHGLGWRSAGVVAGPRRVAAWRVLDAQHFGVAQRRRRVFVLALGGAGAWRCADALLPIIDSLSGHPAPSREAGERAAGSLVARAGRNGGGSNQDVDGGMLVAFGGNNTSGPIQLATACNAHAGRQDFESETLITVPVAFQSKASASQSMNPGPVTPALDVGKGDGMAVAFDTYNQTTGDVAQTLCSRGDTPGGSAHLLPAVASSMAVRRITPVEAERLQGFPDGWTLVPYRGKPAADGPRYKALGNSMAVPCMAWIGQRIQAVEDLHAALLAEAAA